MAEIRETNLQLGEIRCSLDNVAKQIEKQNLLLTKLIEELSKQQNEQE